MDRKKLIQLLKKAGFSFRRHGGNHDVYEKDGKAEFIPRHSEINEQLAKAIIRKWKL